MPLNPAAIVTRPPNAPRKHRYKKPRPMREPRAAGALYRRELRAELTLYRRAVLEAWDEYSPALRHAMKVERSDSGELLTDVQRQDMTQNIIAELLRLVRVRVRGLFTKRYAEKLARKVVAKVVDIHKVQINRQVLRSVGVVVQLAEPWLPTFVDEAVNANVSLIKRLTDLDSVETVVRESVRSGQRVETIRRKIQGEFGKSRSHADLITRDQVLKTQSQIHAKRFTEMGVKRGEWMAIGDQRVRERHRQLHGTIFKLDKPPIVRVKTGERLRPGEDYQCRCQMLPVLADIFPEIAHGPVKALRHPARKKAA